MVLKPAPVRTIGQAAVSTLKQKQEDLVITATLERGRVYYYKDHRFEVGVSTVVSEDLASILEDLYDQTTDSEGEAFEKPYFHVQRGVPRPVLVKEGSRSGRTIRRLPNRSVSANR